MIAKYVLVGAVASYVFNRQENMENSKGTPYLPPVCSLPVLRLLRPMMDGEGKEPVDADLHRRLGDMHQVSRYRLEGSGAVKVKGDKQLEQGSQRQSSVVAALLERQQSQQFPHRRLRKAISHEELPVTATRRVRLDTKNQQRPKNGQPAAVCQEEATGARKQQHRSLNCSVRLQWMPSAAAHCRPCAGGA
ncbi:hypothetical protein HPB47_012888 [Ixodes persulcatus]|uniref:Uncharacterized protein n=1 Tax=Ixodes persulcatus TaxID=34615 RepID=A0AC60NSA0_IXOPE|nr:hypothetical protein HPB47_012888 [Ixodes persulcatus]